MISQASSHYRDAVARGLMQVSIRSRADKIVGLPDGREVVEFINCSYLGLDTHPKLIAGAQAAVEEWGVHLCCARSRFTIDPNRVLEEELSSLFGGRAITFPSVTSAHMSVLPLLAAGALSPNSPRGAGKPVRLVFDRFAHASMQFLKPILAVEAELTTIAH
ncbi:MAG: 7-keto-8-aminopelargonate synthetase, partial [Candidatus Eremiobacteraeota bacterium]|nr:7-keto-8-aminopelargonate synthetase [Candidatus Eremiobacteraeota bacterium]